MSKIGEPYLNSYNGEVEEIIGRNYLENWHICSRCLGIVEPPDDMNYPDGIYICCKCGLRFVRE